jgi:hypothetical protein
MSDLDHPKRKRRLLLWLLAVGVCFVVIVVIAFPIIYFKFFFDPFEGFAGHEEFTRLSGTEAHARLAGPGPVGDWPSSIDPHDVEWMSYKCESTMDSQSCWIQLKLSREAAAKWADWAHANQRVTPTESGAKLYRKIDLGEGTTSDTPPLHRQTGDSPAWWRPPPMDWRATERMAWYKDYDSGVGSGAYSAFDPSAGVLWIYDFHAQHDRLRPCGSPPKSTPDPSIDR